VCLENWKETDSLPVTVALYNPTFVSAQICDFHTIYMNIVQCSREENGGNPGCATVCIHCLYNYNLVLHYCVVFCSWIVFGLLLYYFMQCVV